MPIVERLVDRCDHSRLRTTQIPNACSSLMMNGRNNGKKLMAVRIVAHAFEIIHLISDQNPIQVCPPRLDDYIDHTEQAHFLDRFWSMLSLTLDLVKIQPVSDPRVPFVVKLSMSHLYEE